MSAILNSNNSASACGSNVASNSNFACASNSARPKVLAEKI